LASKFGTLTGLLGKTDIKGSLFDPNKVKKNKQRRYNHLMRGINIYSHSTSEKLVLCERKFACSKLEQNQPVQIDDIETLAGNIDFAFGKAIETGVQSALLNNTKQKIFFDMFMAWDMNLMAQHPKGYEKTFADACIAMDQFIYIQEQIMQGWEIAMFNGKPAIELAMLIDLENGYYYVGHADIILFHPGLKRYRVLEIKTTGAKTLHEAMYKNSSQGTGYSVFLDEIAKDIELTSTFEVFYLVYPTGVGFWKLYEFTKSRSTRAEWLNTLLLDMQRINTYRKVDFWPKRGSSCFDFYRPCQYLDRCDLDKRTFNQTGEFAVITEDELAMHDFDFKFKLSKILETQKELIK
jgi:hypothetical protein